MGKTTKWFRSLLGYKKSSSESSPAAASRSEKEKKPTKWGSLTKSTDKSNNNSANYGSSRYIDNEESLYVEGMDANKHAIAVAAATAAVAEAALAAAHAAAAVVRLTSGGRYVSSDQRRELAATKIQSAFRAYLARRALRALKALVKLQALVRGRIVRKQSADMLRRMQAMARIQARASATRTYSSESSHSTIKSSVFRHPQLQSSGSKSNIMNQKGGEKTFLTSNWLDRWMEECTWNNQRDGLLKHGLGDDEKNDKILEIDTWKPKRNDKTVRSSQYFSAWNDNKRGGGGGCTRFQHPDPSQSSGEASSVRSVKLPPETDQVPAWNYMNSATSRPGSSSSKRGAPFSPSRSEYARSFFGDYLSYPNYMANTESSKAKFRSQSAPKQRLQTEKLGAGRKFVQNVWDEDTCSERDSTLQFNYRSRGYSGSDPLEMLQENAAGFSSTYGGRR